ncbi:transcription elongation factor GreA [Patescibacteria group bacterium]
MKYISSEGLKKFEQELNDRKTKKRKEIAKRIEEAKSLGDLSENAEYSSAKEAQSFNEGRILELEDIIRDAELIDSSSKQKGIVQMGSVIEVELMLGAGKKEKKVFSIVGSHEANPGQGKISNESPLGQAFLDKKIGDKIEIKTPRGKMRYEIISIK